MRLSGKTGLHDTYVALRDLNEARDGGDVDDRRSPCRDVGATFRE
jgi:hypothetical protein